MPSAMVLLLACDSVFLCCLANTNSSLFYLLSHNHDPPLSVCKGIGHISKQYLHALKPERSKLEKKNDRSVKKFSNACKYVLKRYMSYSFVLCQFHYTINGGLAE